MSNGEIFEQLFAYKALTLGYNVSTPIKTSPYDLILDNGDGLLRIQIKSSNSKAKYYGFQTYGVNIGKGSSGKKAYESSEVDIFAIYLIDADMWFIIPFSAINGIVKITLSPSSEISKYKSYRENWDLLS